MDDVVNLDALYDGFCGSLPTELFEAGRALATRLKLTPRSDIPWSEVFKNGITLSAPAFFAAVEPRAASPLVERAVCAHMLAVIEAFGTDRIADGQVPDDVQLRDVLHCARAQRNESLSSIGGSAALALAAEADWLTLEAIAAERQLLLGSAKVTWKIYETVSSGKQTVGLPPTVVLGNASGWGVEAVELARSTLLSVSLGLQFQDDVFDWEDDLAQGGAWAVQLAEHRTGAMLRNQTTEQVRAVVLSSGVLTRMLQSAADQFERALSKSERLGAEALVEWLRPRVQEATRFVVEEQASPGRLLRMRKLAPWAAQVLA